MKKQLHLLILFCFTLFTANTIAQETNCNNERDDDGDGLIDCYDPDCNCPSSFYITADTPSCQFQPDVVPSFQLQELYKTTISMDARQNMVVGDLDGDGINEIVAHDDETPGELYIFNGVDGTLKHTITDAPRLDIFFNGPAIADTDGDGKGEIYIVASSQNNVPANQRRRLLAYEYDPASAQGFTLQWVGDAQIGNNAHFDRAAPQISDFNEDGVPEIYVGNQIFNSTDGTTYAAGPNTNIASRGAHNNATGGSGNRFEPFPIAADILPDSACADCAGVELVAGNAVYSINDTAGTMQVEQSISGSNRNDGLTSIVDFDQDGDLDIAVVSSGRIYVWDGQTNTQIGSTFNLPNTTVGGRLNIADFDNDGVPEIGTAGKHFYIVLENDMTEKWRITTVDGSQRTGSTVFDFEGDGINEVVYRDEKNLFILNGQTGAEIAKIPCVSGTRLDYPIIVDVNNDGQTEIVCACGGNLNGNITVFNSSDQPWVPSRPVWNQHGYHNTQIEDDLTILDEWQDPSIVARDATSGGNTGSINSFLTQATYLQYDGVPTYASPDAIITIDNLQGGTCDTDQTYTITVTITNKSTASNSLPAGAPFTLYKNDPYQAGASKLITGNTTKNLAPGESETLNIDLTESASTFNLYALVNDNGTGTLPLSNGETTTNVGECNYTDNITAPQSVDCTLLPISLLYFKAEKQNTSVELKWATASELNNRHFVIEYSTNGIDFTALTTVNGAGNSNTVKQYSYTHLTPTKHNYYRLKQIDFNQSETISSVAYVRAENVENVQIIRNAQTKQVQLITHPNIEIQSSYVVDVMGRVVYQTTKTQFSLAMLSSGTYFIVVNTNQDIITKKIVL